MVILFVGRGTVQMWTRVGLSGATLKIRIHFNPEPYLKFSFLFCIVSESSVIQVASLNLNPLIVHSLIIFYRAFLYSGTARRQRTHHCCLATADADRFAVFSLSTVLKVSPGNSCILV
jgi:hypothetical protein